MADENDPIEETTADDTPEIEATDDTPVDAPIDEPPLDDPTTSEAASAPAAAAEYAPAESAAAVATLEEPPESTVSIERAHFPPILDEGPGLDEGDRNLDLLLDVPVPITAEIGRAEMPFADVLKLGPGSVIELDKSADEPVDILVNGKYLATGEVVVVGERFGIRILDVVDTNRH